MSVESIVDDVKGRVEPIVNKGQEVAKLSLETFKEANQVVVDGVQELVKVQVEAGKDLVSEVQSSFDKARIDGVKAVASAPVEYLPESRDRIADAFRSSRDLVNGKSDEFVKIVKKGYEGVSAKINGEEVKPKKPARKTAAKKPAAKKAAPAAAAAAAAE